MEVYPGKRLPKVFETNTYDKTKLKSVYNKLRDSKIYLSSNNKERKQKSQKSTISQIEHGFPTGNKDIDVLFLSRLDDKILLNTLNINKATKK